MIPLLSDIAEEMEYATVLISRSPIYKGPAPQFWMIRSTKRFRVQRVCKSLIQPAQANGTMNLPKVLAVLNECRIIAVFYRLSAEFVAIDKGALSGVDIIYAEKSAER